MVQDLIIKLKKFNCQDLNLHKKLLDILAMVLEEITIWCI